ncbi:type II toxin-antitoxin system PemK/MazF family toxin [Agrobacterium vaccinii]|uniref:type II toxin-antitoxin system PemK/MazF family toxin n=1 Tax=Agrobacterium vaccinii TaxID=2735528 RepID=UPI001E4F51DC|nr:type II toxin-antitoxin system PemK/MazF family toxin [Agrobacterium vaccinii]UHS60980.1 type II toxin-antitoxin system PemK/MazF family toxin [Agrobacterium vaccinii]
MRRGDLVTVSVSGDFGKPRPAVIVQSDYFSDTATVTVLLLSGTLVEAPFIRLTVQPSPQNGLTKPSQVMIDKSMTVLRNKLGPVFGRLDDDMMLSITRSLAVFIGIA